MHVRSWPALWGLCWRSGGSLGTYVGDLELLLGLYGRSWAALGAFIGSLHCTLAALGTYVGDLGPLLRLYCLPLLPRRPCNKTRGETSTLPRLTETLPNFTSFFFSFFAPSWLPLGLVLAPSWAPSWTPFGHPNRVKFGQKHLQTLHFFKSVN